MNRQGHGADVFTVCHAESLAHIQLIQIRYWKPHGQRQDGSWKKCLSLIMIKA